MSMQREVIKLPDGSYRLIRMECRSEDGRLAMTQHGPFAASPIKWSTHLVSSTAFWSTFQNVSL